MGVIALQEYGSDLAGREFGKTVYKQLSDKFAGEVCFDFAGVESLGSSFADEVIVKFAGRQGNKVEVRNANRVVRSCLSDVEDESGTKIVYS